MGTSLPNLLLSILYQQSQTNPSGLLYLPYDSIYRLLTPHAYHVSSIRHAINHLTREQLLEKITRDGTVFFAITPAGNSSISAKYPLLNRSVPALKPTLPSFWWMVVFDIPENKRYLRDEIRNHLIANKFILWQKSVYIYPGDEQSPNKVINGFSNLKSSWKPFLSLLKFTPVYTPTDLIELLRTRYNVQNVEKKYQQYSTKSQSLLTALNKKALNKNQRSAVRKESQYIIRDLFEMINEIATIPTFLFNEPIYEQIPQLFQQLNTEVLKTPAD